MIITILSWIAFGLVVGLIARAIMPGKQAMSLPMTTILGIVGSFVGGFVANLLSGAQIFALNPLGFIGAILGSLLVLFLVGLATRNRHIAV